MCIRDSQYIEQWGLEDGFKKYVNEDCTFCGSLVDRIVPGRIRDPKEVAELEQKHGYADPLLDVGEVFGVWVIEGDTKLNDILPFRKAGLEDHVFVTPDMSPYKKRKVRILNGAHTGFVLGAYLAGYDIVRDCMHDDTILGYMNKMLLDEVVPILPLDQDDCKKFAAAVEDRFNNPFVNHELMSISLNSTSKWRARNMPSFLEYIEKNGKLPTCLTMSFAAYIAFYSNDVQGLTDKGLVCKRAKGNEYTVSDDRWALEFYNEHKNDDIPTLVHAVMTNKQMWGQDLTLSLIHIFWRPECTVLFVGYQSPGTLGNALVNGAQEVKLFGEPVQVKASIRQLSGLSGHADKDGLAAWLHAFDEKPKFVFVNHGEDAVAAHWAEKLRAEGYEADAPYNGAVWIVSDGRAACAETGNTQKIVKARTEANVRTSAAYDRLVNMGQRLMEVIRHNQGGANKDLAKFASQIASLCDKWDR